MNKPVGPRVSSPPSEWWKLHLLADVAAAVLEYQKAAAQIGEEKKGRIFMNFPRKKRSCLFRRSSSMATQCVIDKQSSVTCAEGNRKEISLKKGETFGRFEVGSCSTSVDLIQNPNLTPVSSPLSSVVNECNKRRRRINFSQEEEEERSVKKRRIVSVPEWLLNVMMREEINGYDPKLILEKKLYKSDLDKVQSRLSLPSSQVVTSDFLSEEESRVIYEQSVLKKRTEGLSVVLVDPLLKKHVVDLRKWKMGGNWNYVFVDGWNQVVSTNTFKVGNVYHVWSFRSGGGKLCFALVPPRNSSGSGHSGYSSGLSSQ
ncbi:hypothetical protein HA466_0219270 [Hirschfeldia incana]|nr:hypothetical protein HA466_0219270 [Hirschfeldia incana]